MKTLLLAGLIGLVEVAAVADIQPLPTSYLGTAIPITAGTPTVYLGTGTNGGGGEFPGVVSPSSALLSSIPSSLPVLTAFWCIDDQLFFQPGVPGLANITELSDVTAVATANPLEIQYGSVTNGNNPMWTNASLPGNIALPSDAQSRFEMAAWLVSQYDYNTPGDPSTGLAGTAKNNFIQEAIWAITANNQGPNETGNSWGIGSNPTGSSLAGTPVEAWMTQALDNYQKLNANEWALVSWNVDPTGNLGSSGNYSGGNDQTFLAFLEPPSTTTFQNFTPEPGFYGVLAVGLAGLGLAAYRRRINSDIAGTSKI